MWLFLSRLEKFLPLQSFQQVKNGHKASQWLSVVLTSLQAAALNFAVFYADTFLAFFRLPPCLVRRPQFWRNVWTLCLDMRSSKLCCSIRKASVTWITVASLYSYLFSSRTRGYFSLVFSPPSYFLREHQPPVFFVDAAEYNGRQLGKLYHIVS